MNPDIKREIILEHYQNPVNKKEIDDDRYIEVNSNNESCIDDITLKLLIEDNILKDITFTGEACAITTSSTSIMISNLIGKNIDEVYAYIENFENMIEEKEYNKDILNEALVYDEIYKQRSRKNCALLPYKGIKKAILKYKAN